MSELPVKINKVGVIGAGIMGGGIAFQSASSGVDVVLKDISEERLKAGMKEADRLLKKRVSKGILQAQQKDEILARIRPVLSYDELGNTDAVVEAVIEQQDIKEQVLAEVEEVVATDTIIASNTSTISITGLAKVLKRPQNFCGMHFFNPVHVMPLVEVIRGEKSSAACIEKILAYATAMGKNTIVVNDCPGFLVNRVSCPYYLAFTRLIKEGADFRMIDSAIESWGMPMGPAYLTDVVGIDTATKVGNIMMNSYPDRMSCDFKDANTVMFEAGRYGQKNGRGYYEYEADEKGKPIKKVCEQSYEILKPYVETGKQFSAEQVVHRMLIPMCIEMVRCLDERIVETPEQADMAMVYGVGFPEHYGGLCRWMDSIGMRKICDIADGFAQHGEMYQPTDSMRDMAITNKKFFQN